MPNSYSRRISSNSSTFALHSIPASCTSAGCSASLGGATAEYQTGPFLCSEISGWSGEYPYSIQPRNLWQICGRIGGKTLLLHHHPSKSRSESTCISADNFAGLCLACAVRQSGFDSRPGHHGPLRAIILRRNSYLLRSDRSFSEKGGHSTLTAHVRKGRFESIQDIRTASGEGEQNDSATKSPHYPRAPQRKVGPFSCWYPGAGSRTAVGAFPAGDHQQWRHAGFLR